MEYVVQVVIGDPCTFRIVKYHLAHSTVVETDKINITFILPYMEMY